MKPSAKPGIMIAVGVSKKPKPGEMPMPTMPGKPKTDAMFGKTAPKDDTENDHDLDDGGGIPPEAVCYRSADQKCGSCTFYEGGQCSQLKMPVEDQAGCNLYDAKGDDGAPEGMEQ